MSSRPARRSVRHLERAAATAAARVRRRWSRGTPSRREWKSASPERARDPPSRTTLADGLRPAAAHANLNGPSPSTIHRAYRAWREARAVERKPAPTAASAESRTMTLPGIEMLPTATEPSVPAAAPDTVRGGAFVQHVGTSIMMAMLGRLGLYEIAAQTAVGRADAEAVRIGLDATVAAFALGERALEGVRRLRTPTVRLLLQSASIPSPESLPRVDGRAQRRSRRHPACTSPCSGDTSTRMSRRARARRLLRRQPDRAVHRASTSSGRAGACRTSAPGPESATTTYMTPKDDRSFESTSHRHDSLPIWMMPIVNQLRAVVGDEDRVLLAFVALVLSPRRWRLFATKTASS